METNHQDDSYQAKAVFFDAQVQADWAAKTYGADEIEKLKRLFAATGPLAGLRLLEPGCGTGRLTEVLADKVGPRGQVVAMDISPGMVAAASQRLVRFKNVDLRLGSIEAMAKQLGIFDQIICHQVFPHFVDRAAALKILAHLLKPGGRLIISHFIPVAEINDVHRKAGTAVENDLMPPPEIMQSWCRKLRMTIEQWEDDSRGYLLSTRLNG